MTYPAINGDWPYPWIVPQPDHLWDFNNSLADNPGPGKTARNLTNSGGLSFATDWAGRTNHAMQFNTSNYLTAVNNTDLCSLGSTFTIVMGIKVAAVDAGYLAVIDGRSENGVGYVVLQNSFQFKFQINGTDKTWDDFFTVPDTYHHIVVTLSGGNLKVYRNGAQYGQTETSVATPTNNTVTPFAVGALNGGGLPWPGQIYQLAVIKGTALTDTQIASLYNTWVNVSGDIYKRNPNSPLTTTIWQSELQYHQQINISATGSVETNYLLPLRLHYGSAQGDATGQDIFLGGNCRTDFTDVAFSDANGNRLNHYIVSSGNYEVIVDNANLGANSNYIDQSGNLYAANVPGKATGLWKYDGEDWTQLTDYNPFEMFWISQNGYAYISHGYLIKRTLASTLGPGSSWSTVLDLTSVSGYTTLWGFDEDRSGGVYNGRIYIGQYQVAAGPAVIWYSDNGTDFTKCYDDATHQHVHSIVVDQTNGKVYAQLDSNTALQAIIASSNGGTNWAEVDGSPGSVGSLLAGSGYRIFMGEDSWTDTFLRTTNDTTFSALSLSRGALWISKLNDNLYSGTLGQDFDRYASLFRSEDLGQNWNTIWLDSYSADQSGFYKARLAGTPTGAEYQLPIGGYTMGSTRLFDGGDHYQAIVVVKVASLPNATTPIFMHYGGQNSYGSIAGNSKAIFPSSTKSNLLAHYSFVEGSGTAIADQSGNNYNGTLTPGTGSWLSGAGRRAGSSYPYIIQSATNSYQFAGDGYINVADTAALRLTKNFTLLAWVRFAGTGQEYGQIVGKGSGNARWALTTSSVTGDVGRYLRFFYTNEGNPTRSVSLNRPIGNLTTTSSGGWHQVGIVVDNATPPNYQFIVDGYCYAADALAEAVSSNTGSLRIGADSLGGSLFTGSVGDVQIYSVALTSDQVRQLYEDRPQSGASQAAKSSVASVDHSLYEISWSGGSGLSLGNSIKL